MNTEPNPPQRPDGELLPQDEQTQQSPSRSLPFEAPSQAGAPRQNQPRRLSLGTTLLLIVLAVLLIGGGSGLIYYTAVYQPNLKHAQLTAVAHTNATSTAQAPATATSIAQENATATAVVVSRDPYLPNKGTWVGNPLGSLSPLSPVAGGLSSHVTGADYANLVYQVQVTIVSGNTTFGGLLFRFQLGGGGYFFLVNIHGSYQFGTFSFSPSGFKLSVLQSGTSPAIKTGLNQVNTLAVVAQGSSFDFYVNLQHITSVSDSSFSQGAVGVFSYNTSDTQAEVDIGDNSLWTL